MKNSIQLKCFRMIIVGFLVCSGSKALGSALSSLEQGIALNKVIQDAKIDILEDRVKDGQAAELQGVKDQALLLQFIVECQAENLRLKAQLETPPPAQPQQQTPPPPSGGVSKVAEVKDKFKKGERPPGRR